ncbi:Asp-tRNA(Asn)/Glu-tRNA(Gln) amidotransferase subunit GatC [soil metagenome]
MAELTKEDILKLARLSRLKLSDAEVNEYQKEISDILEYVRMLDKADTKGLKPTYQVTGLSNVSRSDELIDYGISPEELLKNLPDREKNYIKVKRML